MIESVKRVMKVCVIGGVLHYGLNFVYDLGKARMLGAIAKEDPEIMELLQTMSDHEPEDLSKRLKIRLISLVALHTANKEEMP